MCGVCIFVRSLGAGSIQKRQVMVTSFGCCSDGRGAPQSVGGGGADVSEDADLSGGGDDGLGGGRLNGWFVAGSPGFVESSGKTHQTVSNSFSISGAIFFWSAWKGEVVNVVEVLIDKSVEVWERLRLGTYSICYRVWKVHQHVVFWKIGSSDKVIGLTHFMSGAVSKNYDSPN